MTPMMCVIKCRLAGYLYAGIQNAGQGVPWTGFLVGTRNLDFWATLIQIGALVEIHLENMVKHLVVFYLALEMGSI